MIQPNTAQRDDMVGNELAIILPLIAGAELVKDRDISGPVRPDASWIFLTGWARMDSFSECK